mgnify:CR=1 FL=1
MPILECNQLSKSYGKVPALDGVSFAIEPGPVSYTHLTLPTILLV